MMNEYYPDTVSSPADTLEELIQEKPEAGTTNQQVWASCILGHLRAGARLTPNWAAQLEATHNVPAEFWLARERDYRQSLAVKEFEFLPARALIMCEELLRLHPAKHDDSKGARMADMAVDALLALELYLWRIDREEEGDETEGVD